MLAATRRALGVASRRRCLSDVSSEVLPRTIPESVLKFEMRTYIHGGRKLPIPEAHRIGEYKVKLRVCVSAASLFGARSRAAPRPGARSDARVSFRRRKADDLGLDALSRDKLAYLTGPRYDANTHTLTLTAERFPSRAENRRYLIHQLELLKAAAEGPDDEFDAQWRDAQG